MGAGGRDVQVADSGLAGRDAWTLGAALHVMLTGADTEFSRVLRVLCAEHE